MSPTSPLKKNVFVFDTQANLNVTTIQQLNLMPSNGCDLCKIDKLPLRSHHCKKCDRCVRRFDHHWEIIGGCIGEENFFCFSCFLFFDLLSSMFNEYAIIKLIDITKYSKRWYNYYKFVTVYSIFNGIYCFCLVVLFWVQFYLLSTNQSLYELFHADQCPYLAMFKMERIKILEQRGFMYNKDYVFRPFDSGVVENIGYMFNKFLKPKEKIKWEEIFHNNLKKNKVNLKICGCL